MRKLLAAALVVLAACGDSTGPNAHVGAYTLTSIDGQSPPQIVFQNTAGTFEITGGLVTLNSDGTFTDQTDFRITSGTEVFTDTDIATGTYTISGNNVTFRPTSDPGDNYNMTLSGRTLTQVEPEFTLVYER